MPEAIRNKFGLTERDTKTIEGIFQKYTEVKEVRIFGSRAKGNYKQGSDIDIAIINKGVSSKTIAALSSEFTESSLPYKVDLIYLPDLKEAELVSHINRVGVVFYLAD